MINIRDVKSSITLVQEVPPFFVVVNECRKRKLTSNNCWSYCTIRLYATLRFSAGVRRYFIFPWRGHYDGDCEDQSSKLIHRIKIWEIIGLSAFLISWPIVRALRYIDCPSRKRDLKIIYLQQLVNTQKLLRIPLIMGKKVLLQSNRVEGSRRGFHWCELLFWSRISFMTSIEFITYLGRINPARRLSFPFRH